jgi:hypothetical protein
LVHFRHAYAIHRAGHDTEFTACAFGRDHRVHLFRGTQYCVNGADLNTFEAAYAHGLIDNGNLLGHQGAIVLIKRLGITPEQLSEGDDSDSTARWALIDVGITTRNSLGIGPTTRIAAVTTLGLR